MKQTFLSLMNAINDIAENYQIPVIYSTHPRSWKKIEEREFKFHPLVRQLKPFGFFDYNALQKMLLSYYLIVAHYLKNHQF